MPAFLHLLKRFRKDESGIFAVFFALLAVVLIAMSGAVVDFTQMQTARSRMQTVIDSAALSLQSKITTTTSDDTTIKTKVQTLVDQSVTGTGYTATIQTVATNTTTGKLNIQAQLTVPTYFVQLVGVRSLTTHLTSEVTQSSSDLEVSVSLDITGSMAGTKISDLIAATNTLIDTVIKTSQTPSYSKMAIVPWAYAANLGTYANNIRGTPTAGVSIASVSYLSATAPSITGITRANPGVVTVASATGLANGDWVYISGVSGMTQVNGTYTQIANLSGTSFELSGVCTSSSCGYNKYTSGGTATKCAATSCQEVVTTSSANGLSNGNYAYITGVTNMSGFSGNLWQVSSPTSTTFIASGSSPNNGIATASTGKSYCTTYGCTYYYFTSSWGWGTLYQASHCATERTTNAYTDAAPTTTLLGFNYTSNADECVDPIIQPLTSDKTALHALTNSLTAGGSTAGHLGLGWGWYMIAPNFAYLWPTASQPAAYGKANLVKAIIFMTDGDFNTQYCNGVISQDSGSGSTEINCNAPNGTSKSQAQSLCDAIKVASNHIELYVIGFDLGGNTTALNFLRGCATDTSHFYQADDGTDLAAAFAAIAQNLSDLRLSK
jgi:Flp pilus assembly protein TadG